MPPILTCKCIKLAILFLGIPGKVTIPIGIPEVMRAVDSSVVFEPDKPLALSHQATHSFVRTLWLDLSLDLPTSLQDFLQDHASVPPSSLRARAICFKSNHDGIKYCRCK